MGTCMLDHQSHCFVLGELIGESPVHFFRLCWFSQESDNYRRAPTVDISGPLSAWWPVETLMYPMTCFLMLGSALCRGLMAVGDS